MIKFKKMHGNGNDFIVINALTENIKFTKNKIAKLACRRKGIGFDQLILVCPPTKIDTDFLIKFYNSDGSSAKMCLNGIRCAALFVWQEELSPHKTINLQTASRNIECTKKNSNVEALIEKPFEISEKALIKEFSKKLSDQRFSLIDCGNKHLCIKQSSIKSFDLEALYEKLQPAISKHNFNLSIYKKIKGQVHIRTFENGAGETLSCGSASASVASIALQKDQKIKVSSKGGNLQFASFEDKLKMTGPAANVFSGTID